MKNKGTYKKMTETSAVRTLERFFLKYPDSDTITPSQILSGVSRNTAEYEGKNEGWLSNKLTGLYYHDLVRAHYSYHPWRKLEKLELTIKGKRALGRAAEPVIATDDAMPADSDTSIRRQSMSQQDLARAIVDFRNENPDLEVVFEVKLKPMETLPMKRS